MREADSLVFASCTSVLSQPTRLIGETDFSIHKGAKACLRLDESWRMRHFRCPFQTTLGCDRVPIDRRTTYLRAMCADRRSLTAAREPSMPLCIELWNGSRRGGGAPPTPSM